MACNGHRFKDKAKGPWGIGKNRKNRKNRKTQGKYEKIGKAVASTVNNSVAYTIGSTVANTVGSIVTGTDGLQWSQVQRQSQGALGR